MRIIHTNERTAGLTSEAAVTAIGNRYNLVLVAARRMRELGRGDMPKIVTRNGHAVTAMLEIEQGHVGLDYLVKEIMMAPRRNRIINTK